MDLEELRAMVEGRGRPRIVCPESRQALAIAQPELLDRVNSACAQGSLRNRGGEPVGEPLEAGLLREDGRVLYPVRDGIPVLLIEEAIDVPG